MKAKTNKIESKNSPVIMGRPPKKVVTDDLVKTSLTMKLDQILFLDILSGEIRRNSRAVLDRGSIIRAMVEALKDSNIDLKHVESEEELTKVILKQLQK